MAVERCLRDPNISVNVTTREQRELDLGIRPAGLGAAVSALQEKCFQQSRTSSCPPECPLARIASTKA
jgi:hypothetical protein